MASFKVPVTAEMEDGRILKASVDQRDYAKFEGADVVDSVHTKVRYLTWSALSRTKQYSGDWAAFNEVDCIEASDVPEEPTSDDSLDPGQKAPSVEF